MYASQPNAGLRKGPSVEVACGRDRQTSTRGPPLPALALSLARGMGKQASEEGMLAGEAGGGELPVPNSPTNER